MNKTLATTVLAFGLMLPALSMINCGMDVGDSADGGCISTATGSEIVVLKLESLGGVLDNPPNKTVFDVAVPMRITKIMTYHWNSGSGATPGTLSVKNTSTQTVHGPWNVVGVRNGVDGTPGSTWPTTPNGPPYLYWLVQPGVIIPPGTYEVVDSNPATWSYNSEMGNMGCAWVFGIVQDQCSTTNPGGASSSGGGASSSVLSSSFSPSSTTTTSSSSSGGAVSGNCNTLQQRGNVVSRFYARGRPPAQSGGTIVDGTYVMVESTQYWPSGDPGPSGYTVQDTIVFSGNTMNGVSKLNQDPQWSYNQTYTTNGTTLSISQTCPAITQHSRAYTATATTLTLVSYDNWVDVYQKQ